MLGCITIANDDEEKKTIQRKVPEGKCFSGTFALKYFGIRIKLQINRKLKVFLLRYSCLNHKAY